MTKADLKFGMVVEIKNEDGVSLAMVTSSENYERCISGTKCWYPLDNLDDNLTYTDDVITKVYNVAHWNEDAYKLSTEGRKLLWERNEPKKMTIAEIEKELGYPIEVVNE